MITFDGPPGSGDVVREKNHLVQEADFTYIVHLVLVLKMSVHSALVFSTLSLFCTLCTCIVHALLTLYTLYLYCTLCTCIVQRECVLHSVYAYRTVYIWDYTRAVIFVEPTLGPYSKNMPRALW